MTKVSSAYGAPGTPIASAKRPRTSMPPPPPVAESSSAAAAASSSSAQPMQLASPAPPPQGLMQSAVTMVSGLLSPGRPSGDKAGGGGDADGDDCRGALSFGDDADDADADGKWRGHMSALFSPVLRFLGAAGEDEGATSEDSPTSSTDDMSELAETVERMQPAPAAAAAAAAAAPPPPPPAPPAAAPAAPAEDEEDEDDCYDDFNPYLFMKHLPPYENVRIPGKLCLPPRHNTRSSPTVTLVLDLDETLVHCTVDEVANADVVFPVVFNGEQYQVHVQKRPHVDEFLRAVAEKFEVVVFTASQRVYADKLLDILDPGRKLIKHRLFRDACLLVEGNYLKDLNVLGRDLSTCILVDNSPHAFGYQMDNGVPIESWFDDRNDTELLKLMPLLNELQHATDVRPVLRDTFKTAQIAERS